AVQGVVSGRGVAPVFAVAFLARQVQPAHASDAQGHGLLQLGVLLGLAFKPQLQPHFGLLLAALLFALVGLQPLDAAMTDGGQLLVFRMTQGTGCALLPVFGGFPHLHGAAHPIFHALGVLAGLAFAVIAHKDGLPELEPLPDGLHGVARCAGVMGALVAVVLEAVGAFLGALN